MPMQVMYKLSRVLQFSVVPVHSFYFWHSSATISKISISKCVTTGTLDEQDVQLIRLKAPYTSQQNHREVMHVKSH